MSTLTQLFTSIANAIRTKKGTSALIEAEDFPTEIETIQTGITPTGTINITQNGTIDVTNYANANVNVEASSYVLPNGIRFGYAGTFPSNFNTSNITGMNNFLRSASITELPFIDTSNVVNMENCFYACQYLTTLPVLDISKVTNLYRTFYNCSALSNNSLNNILQMIANATSYSSVKTLNYIGLSSTQATTCTRVK